MKPDDLARVKAHMADVPWDDVKEQRVLGRVMAERKKDDTKVSPPRWTLVAIPAAAAAVAAFAAVTMLRPATTAQTTPAPTTVTAPAVPSANGQHSMALADGSQALMLRDADLQVEEQRADLVRIVQRRGAVRYDVRPDPARQFTVRAGTSIVRVRGTAFTVTLLEDATEVTVHRGRVDVEDRGRIRELGAGESLRVSADAPDASETVDSLDITETPGREGPHARTAAELQARADAARLAGNTSEAAAALQTLIVSYPRDPRVPAAIFTLGRVERSRGREAAAAKAFEKYLKAAPRGPLAEDALAESAASWSAAGATDSARAAATSYLARYPHGSHVQRMKAIATP